MITLSEIRLEGHNDRFTLRRPIHAGPVNAERAKFGGVSTLDSAHIHHW